MQKRQKARLREIVLIHWKRYVGEGTESGLSWSPSGCVERTLQQSPGGALTRKVHIFPLYPATYLGLDLFGV